MDSLTILSLISIVLFHASITIPLGIMVSEKLVLPIIQKESALKETPRWVIVVVVSVVIAIAFSLRSHVLVEASKRKH